ncbi:MAG: radical SAM family heme chaperone HemW [Gemmatimonadota bacterium]
MTAGIHLYVHVPFCTYRCPYCAFYNVRPHAARETAFLDGVEREIEVWRARGAFEAGPLATLYWGGGTPSRLSGGGFLRLADLALAVAEPDPDMEWTVEVNPSDVGAGLYARYRERGVTRISVGAQSFDPDRLRFLGRDHGAARARDAVADAAEAGFADVSLDLVFNLAVEDRRRAWPADLGAALELPITHLSLYGLTLEPGTPFHRRAAGGARLTLDDAGYGAEYLRACRAARRRGFEHYEVSSFARPGHRSRHNQSYWSGASYLGLGPAAHSYDGERRWANVASLEGWARALETGADPREFVEVLGPAERDLESLYLGLRTVRGLPEDHPGLARPQARPIVEGLVGRGMLRRREGRVACTERGFLVLDAILESLSGR